MVKLKALYGSPRYPKDLKELFTEYTKAARAGTGRPAVIIPEFEHINLLAADPMGPDMRRLHKLSREPDLLSGRRGLDVMECRERPTIWCIAARHKGKIIGFALIDIIKAEAKVVNMVVDKKYRYQGAEDALLFEIKTYAANRDCAAVFISDAAMADRTMAEMLAAHKFEVDSISKNWYGPNRDGYNLVLVIDPSYIPEQIVKTVGEAVARRARGKVNVYDVVHEGGVSPARIEEIMDSLVMWRAVSGSVLRGRAADERSRRP